MHPTSALVSERFGDASILSNGTSGTSEETALAPSSSLKQHAELICYLQSAPEFLRHLFSMLQDPSNFDMISWSIPSHNETGQMGGGERGIGKIVVHNPEVLQKSVLGKYYRHSKYASFQRQLNYFGFKKRMHGGKKDKLSPCSYVHKLLTDDVGSLFTLKRRPPTKKRKSEDDKGAVFTESSCGSSTCDPTLLEILGTSLPPPDILFNDHVDSADGQVQYHNVDSSLVDLAMIY